MNIKNAKPLNYSKLSPLFIVLIFTLFSANCRSQTEPEAQPVLRILTFNILHGATTKGDFDLDKIAAVINEVAPDLVALQEVDFKTHRAKQYDLATELGIRTKMAPLFGKAMDFDGGGYGEGILTQMPIIASQNIPLPHSPGNEPRTALALTVELKSGDTICFIGTHLDHKQDNTDRLLQTNKINREFSNGKIPTILAGDFNATPECEAIRNIKNFWADASRNDLNPTFPSANPAKKIDYIFYFPETRWKVLESRVICDSVASDHCALFSVLKLIK